MAIPFIYESVLILMRKSSCNITKITNVMYVKWLNNNSGLKAISNGTNTSNIILENEVKKSQYILNTDSGCIIGILLMIIDL